MTDTAVPAAAPQKTGMERLLDGIERLGNKMPDPAVLFLWLCLGVIVLSQALAWLDVKATYEVVSPPPAAAEETYYGGSVYPTYVGPTTPAQRVRSFGRQGLTNSGPACPYAGVPTGRSPMPRNGPPPVWLRMMS